MTPYTRTDPHRLTCHTLLTGVLLALNPARLTGRNSDTEWNLHLYNNAYGADFTLNNIRSYRGKVSSPNGSGANAARPLAFLQICLIYGVG